MIFKIDLLIVRIRKAIKSRLPTRFLAWLQYRRSKHPNTAILPVHASIPWMSPNIWNEITEFYRALDCPVILEFGMGGSTVKHLEEMLTLKKVSYIGIENDPTWFWQVLAILLKTAHAAGAQFSIETRYFTDTSMADVDIFLTSGDLQILLRLRRSVSDYVAALDRECDVIIIDGISRKQCVHRVLASKLLRPGGLLMLMEAGRGSSQWWEGKLENEDDYSDELQELLTLGGTLLDGNGLDNWPGCKKRSPRPVSYFYPMEACKLIMP